VQEIKGYGSGDIGHRGSAPAEQIRKEGSGRKQKIMVDPILVADLQALL